MIDLEKLNESLGKQWKNEEEIDWVYVAKHMPADLKFMKENAANLRPSFVVENPALLDEYGCPGDIYMKWIGYYNKNVKTEKESLEIIDYLNKKIEEDPDFSEDDCLECIDTCVGFCGMDQGELYHGKIYLNDSDVVISMEDPWEETKKTLLGLCESGEESSEFWDYVEELQCKTKEELLEELSTYREISKEDKALSEEELLGIIASEYYGEKEEENAVSLGGRE